MISIELPIYWTTSSKTILLGLNWYRNAHYHLQNKFKQEFTELVQKQAPSAAISGPFSLTAELYYKNPTCDPSNIIPIIEKAVLDALQISGTIQQDNVLHHLGTSWTVAGQDKLNPRCIITVTPQG